MKAFDPSLYLVTDRRFCRGRDLVQMVLEAVEGGVTLVQLREKGTDPLEFAELARVVIAALRPYDVPVILNDHVEIAVQVGAAGVHLGAEDMPVSQARALLGESAIVGYSLESSTNLAAIPWKTLDYVAASPVFPTDTKLDVQPPFFLEGLRELRRQCALPLVGIGGVHLENIGEMMGAGADGAAIVSAILAAPDIRKAASDLKKQIAVGREVKRVAN